MADSTLSGSLLSCRTCKLKKVRCSRGLPICDRCKVHGIECSYPERVKRRSRTGAVARLAASNGSLPAILERLENVEQLIVGLHGSPRGQNVESGASGADGKSPQTRAELLQEAPCSGTDSPSSVSTAASRTNADNDVTRTLDSRNSFADTDISNALMDAISQIQKSRLQDIAKASITAGITLPTSLLRNCIQNYFAYVRTESFHTLVDSSLIKMIPNIIDRPHVHLDAGIIVVYYTILYHGCSLPAAFIDTSNAKYARQIYLCCLRALPNWQREARGTMTDFVAATLMARAAAECFDYEMSWRMYKLACEYATDLNMHNLDSEDALCNPDQTKVDGDRKGLWELIQIDLFFRLLYNKPPTLTSSISNWRVNFPWMSADSQSDMHSIPTMTFLVGSRITLTLIQFFKLLEEERHSAHVLPAVEKLCEDINQSFQDWQLDEWLQQNQDNDIYWWMVVDVSLMGYTCIVFMLRKLRDLPLNFLKTSGYGAHSPSSTLMLDASRKILNNIYRLLAKHPVAEIMSMMVGFYQTFIPYGVVANNILRSSNPRAFVSDLELLERVTERIITLSNVERDFRPLVRVLERFNHEAREHINVGGDPLMAV